MTFGSVLAEEDFDLDCESLAKRKSPYDGMGDSRRHCKEREVRGDDVSLGRRVHDVSPRNSNFEMGSFNGVIQGRASDEVLREPNEGPSGFFLLLGRGSVNESEPNRLRLRLLVYKHKDNFQEGINGVRDLAFSHQSISTMGSLGSSSGIDSSSLAKVHSEGWSPFTSESNLGGDVLAEQGVNDNGAFGSSSHVSMIPENPAQMTSSASLMDVFFQIPEEG